MLHRHAASDIIHDATASYLLSYVACGSILKSFTKIAIWLWGESGRISYTTPLILAPVGREFHGVAQQFCAYYLSISDRPLPRDWAVKAQMYFEPRSTSRASCSQLEPEAWSWTNASFFRHVMNGPKDHWISAPSFKENLSFLPRLRACYKIEYPWFHFQHCVHSHFAPCRVKQRQKWCVLRTSGIQIPNSQEKSISW